MKSEKRLKARPWSMNPAHLSLKPQGCVVVKLCNASAGYVTHPALGSEADHATMLLASDVDFRQRQQ